MSVTVYKYGVHHKWTRDLPEQVREQVRLSHELRNDLVRTELDHRHAMDELWSSYPQVAAAEEARDAAEERAAAAEEAWKAAKVTQRTRNPKGPVAEDRKAARAAVKEARATRREAITQVREEAREQIIAINDARKAAQKALYRVYVDRGLYWATFNAVLDSHKTAVKRIDAARAQGRPAQLRFHRWDGTGRIAVQLQRQKDHPARTPSLIANAEASRWRNVLTLPWVDPADFEEMTRSQQRQAGRLVARMRTGSTLDDDGQATPAWADLPLQMHRMLPADADITGAELVFSRTGPDLRAHLCVTAKIPDPQPVTDGPAIAVHLGWRHDPDAGHTAVATWASDTPVEITPALRGLIHTDATGTTGQIRIPDALVDRITHHQATRSARDTRLDEVRDQLATWLAEHGPVDHPTRADEDGVPEQLTAAGVTRWRNPARFAALAIAWREDPPTGMTDIVDTLESWRAWDKKAWAASEHGRTKALAHRDDLYRQAAAELAGIASHLIVDDTNLATLARTDRHPETMDTTGLPGTVLDTAAARRTNLAPGTLREALIAAATRDGLTVTKAPAKDLSTTCTQCGQTDATQPHTGWDVTCQACGHTRDVDRAASTLLLRRHADTPRAAA